MRAGNFALLFRAVLFRAVLFRAVLFRAVLFRAVLLRAVLLRAVLCRAVLFRVLFLALAVLFLALAVLFLALAVLFLALAVRFPAAAVPPPARRFRVAAAFRPAADFAALLRAADARPPSRPPFFDADRFSFLPRPEPLFLPPPDSWFTVAQARAAASFRETPRSSYPSSMCRARRRCLDV